MGPLCFAERVVLDIHAIFMKVHEGDQMPDDVDNVDFHISAVSNPSVGCLRFETCI